MPVALTNREAHVMAVLWSRGPSTVAEVRDSLDDELAYTTVLTILPTLEAKGYVGYEVEGRAHRYLAKVRQEAARKNAVKHLMTKLFQGSAELMLMQLVTDHKLDDEQVQRIRKLLDEKSGKRK